MLGFNNRRFRKFVLIGFVFLAWLLSLAPVVSAQTSLDLNFDGIAVVLQCSEGPCAHADVDAVPGGVKNVVIHHYQYDSNGNVLVFEWRRFDVPDPANYGGYGFSFPMDPATVVFKFILDPDNEVQESNELNNEVRWPQPATSTPTASSTPTNVPTSTPTASSMPTNVPTSTPTASSTPTNVPTSTPTASSTPTNVPTSTPTASSTPTNVPTSTPTATPTPTPWWKIEADRSVDGWDTLFLSGQGLNAHLYLWPTPGFVQNCQLELALCRTTNCGCMLEVPPGVGQVEVVIDPDNLEGFKQVIKFDYQDHRILSRLYLPQIMSASVSPRPSD